MSAKEIKINLVESELIQSQSRQSSRRLTGNDGGILRQRPCNPNPGANPNTEIHNPPPNSFNPNPNPNCNPNSNPHPLASNLSISFLSTLISRSLFYPIDTLKTNLQYKNNEKLKGSNVKEFIRNLNLFKGLGITIALACPAGAIYLSSYDILKWKLGTILNNSNNSELVDHTANSNNSELVDHTANSNNDNTQRNQFLINSLAGAGAEGIASILFTPMDVLKQKMQTGSSSNDTISTVKDLYKSHGIYGFYRGYFLTQLVFVPFSAIYFSVYEKSKKVYSSLIKNEIGLGSSFACSLFAASIASVITNPLDVIKTRIQIRTGVSTTAVIKELYYTQGGLCAFGKGLGARIIWAAPSMSLSVALWEIGKSFFGLSS